MKRLLSAVVIVSIMASCSAGTSRSTSSTSTLTPTTTSPTSTGLTIAAADSGTTSTNAVSVSNPPSNVGAGNDQLGGSGYKGRRPGGTAGGTGSVDIAALQACLAAKGISLPSGGAAPGSAPSATGGGAPQLDAATQQALADCGFKQPVAQTPAASTTVGG